ncbi:helix-turn-helix transcriptional regulator [Saccharopolyspora indica]|uniref:winged helix-turn-helix transcriptional regulator n=1 Tax=Saccharopolyspora indica TaxID=1229659 RepID=UPI0022EB7D64|nr:helix-turn-helix domain-containing protein [Saccharopolyspora indica]MDA3650109.1 helix-turn-helix domain-containing protein [Saccharopolyspora indica]
MLGRTYDTQVCSAARALEAVGERWSLLIVRDVLFAGATRFADFQRLGIATNVLAKRLDALVDSGILERRPGADHSDRGGYAATRKGLDLAPVIIALTQWGDRWAAPDGPPILYRHTGCGGPIVERTTCSNCGEITDLAQVHVVHGPGMPQPR